MARKFNQEEYEFVREQYLDYVFSELVEEKKQLLAQEGYDPVRIKVLNDLINEGYNFQEAED